MRKVVALDVDGVLLDSYGHLMSTVGENVKMLDKWSDEDINNHFRAISKNVDWWRTIPQMVSPSAINFEFDYYLTSIPTHLIEARLENLKSLGFPIKPLIASFDKVSVCLEKGIDVLVDDKEETIIECRNFGINGILVKPYYYDCEYGKDLTPIRSILEVNTQINNRYGR